MAVLQKIYPRDGVPFGRPNWVDGKVPPVGVILTITKFNFSSEFCVKNYPDFIF